MQKERLKIDSIPTLGLALSVGVKAGRLVFCSGMAPLDAEGNLVGVGDIARQTEQTLDNLEKVLAAGGAGFEDVVKTTVFVTDARHFQTVNDIYARRFGKAPPARSTVQVGMMHPDLMIEIEAIAVVEDAA
ncbi:RidA family protein [Pigmentiphaga kullae]|uniref:Endoribonuclease L-PSP n=1 Tax=Pigmentiphaga kullae TaxID=151784 RepID=A0A4Q7NK21_9BURK|nr:RidA family protein [Pigmentiphaga kullae]RZS85333.1 endoribonuclease L-PSP [Pigmentiphaga kullae]